MESHNKNIYTAYKASTARSDPDELRHWKYIKREKVNGKWKYWYDDDSLKKDVKTAAANVTNKVVSKTLETVNKAPDKLNKVVDKAKEVAAKIYDDPNNIYNITSSSYNEKIEKVKQTDEWKKIVEAKDPEYVKTTADGKTQYLIDDYVVKKKHPVLDIISDVAADRKITVNEITKESSVAGLKENAFSAITTGMMVADVAAKVLTEKFKLKQGTYDDEINAFVDTIDAGSSYVEKTISGTGSVNVEDVKKVYDALSTSSTVSDTKNLAKSIDEGNVVAAAQVIVQSDAMKNAVGSNEYYKMLESSLSGMSEEEIALVNLLVREMMSAKHDGLSDDEYLQHYGVKGMKWGVRRYQNADGTLTSEGRKRVRREYKEDNENAYELGKSATIYGRAAAKSMKRTIRYENRVDKSYEKDPSGNSRRTKFWRKRWDASSATTAQLSEMYRLNRDAAEKHCKGLIDKYGEEAVKPIKYKDVKLPKGEYSPESIRTINERTNNLSDYARNGAISVWSSAFAYTMGIPVAVLFRPTTTSEKAYRLENRVYAMNWKEQNKKK